MNPCAPHEIHTADGLVATIVPAAKSGAPGSKILEEPRAEVAAIRLGALVAR